MSAQETARAGLLSRNQKPRLLDGFCCAGGAARGYQQAGFYVIGVDVVEQPNYAGDEFVHADFFSPKVWRDLIHEVDAVHASPPCQDHSMLRNSAGTHGTGWMLEAALRHLREWGGTWVVENVVGSGLARQSDLFGEYGVTLCGASFGLGAGGMDLNRHRLFQSNVPISAPPCSHRPGQTIGVYGHGTNAWHRELLGRNITVAEMREAMGIDWMTREELSQAIPPAYTRHVGEQLMQALECAA